LVDLLLIVLITWGLTGGTLLLHHRRMAHGEGWFLLFLGGLLTYAAYRVPALQPFQPATQGPVGGWLEVAPQVVIPAVYLGILVVYVVEGASTAAWLILGLCGVQAMFGIVVPMIVHVTEDTGLLSGSNIVAVAGTPGLREAVVRLAALATGMYLLTVAYQFLANRFEQRWMWLSSWLALLLSGWTEGSLFVVSTAWGTSNWESLLGGQIVGWLLASLAIWPLLGVYLSQLSAATLPEGRPFTRPALSVFNHTFALQKALRDSQTRLWRLNEGLKVLTEIRRVIVRSQAPEQMMDDVCRCLTRTGHMKVAWIAMADGEDGDLKLAASAGRLPAPMKSGGSRGRREASWLALARLALGRRTPEVVDEIAVDERTATWKEEAVRIGVKSAAAIPIRSGPNQWGVLCVGRKAVRAFDDETLGLMVGVAEDVGYGLHRLALEQQSAKRIRELDTLHEIGMSLISERGVPALLQNLIDRAVELLEAEGGAVFQSDVSQRLAECVAVSKLGRAYAGTRLAFGDGMVGRAAELGDISNTIGGDPSGDESQRERAFLVVPLKWQRAVNGVMLVMRDRERPFTVVEQDLLGLLATQATVAMENARLIEVERRRGAELEALREASLRMTSNLEWNAVLEAILDNALRLTSAWDAHIFLYDGEHLAFAAALWAGDVQHAPFSEPRQGGLTYTVARTGERLVVEDVRADPLFKDAPWKGAIVGIPLLSKDHILGVMNVAYEDPHRFSDEELRILDLLADQASAVLENARLFERTAADRRRLQLLYDITRELTASTDPDQILRRAPELTKENLGGLMGSIVLVDPDSLRLRVGSLVGYDNDDLEALESELDMRIGKGFVGWIARERQAALLSDTLDDPRWSPVPGVDDEVRSALGAPILVDGELLGVLVIFHREPGVFEDEHLDLLVAICRQVALAWTNADRYRQLERRLAEQTVLQHAAQVINRRMEMGPLLEEIVEQVSSTLGYEYVGVSLVEEDSLVLMASRGHDAGDLRLTFDQGITGRVLRTNQPALVGDVDRDPDFVRYFPNTRSELAVPIRKGDVAIGVLNVESPELDGLAQDDLRLLSLLADQMAVAIENAALYERLRSYSAELETTVAERTAELASALERAREADRLKTQFVSDVSHELRTPLSNIRLYVELLSQAPMDRHPGYIETLKRETERLVTLIEDLLSISRLDAGTMLPELSRIDLNRMSRALVDDRRKLFSERGLSLHLEIGSPSTEVMADENLIAQVVGNLLTNAMHYTPEGGAVTLRTGYADDSEWVKLSVSDTGVGILPEEQDHLFDRFFRGSASQQMKNPGTGLGLAISHEIVARHDGRIEVESVPGEGSTITVWLPTSGPKATEVGGDGRVGNQTPKAS
jgi:GAF domain-containing protein/uncharacterized PurR-regulated membrane protein YhhQ (DUF165 family)